jgi:hypothetical protein
MLVVISQVSAEKWLAGSNKQERTLHAAFKAQFSIVSSTGQHFAGTTAAAALVVLPTKKGGPMLAHQSGFQYQLNNSVALIRRRCEA